MENIKLFDSEEVKELEKIVEYIKNNSQIKNIYSIKKWLFGKMR